MFFAAALLLPPLPIALGDSGPHACLLIAGVGLLLGDVSRHWRIRPCSLNAAFTALFGALFVSIAMAALHSGGEAAAASFARVALVGISIYVFFYTAYGPAAISAGKLGAPPVPLRGALSALCLRRFLLSVPRPGRLRTAICLAR